MKPAVRVEHLTRRLGVLKIARSYRRTAHQQLPVAGDADLHVGKGLSRAAWPVLADPAQRNTSTFGGAVGAKEWNPGHFKKAHDPGRHGSSRVGKDRKSTRLNSSHSQ